MYQFTDENIREHGEAGEVLINDGKPFEIQNSKLANSLLIRGIIKLARDVAKEAISKGIDSTIEKVTEKIKK